MFPRVGIKRYQSHPQEAANPPGFFFWGLGEPRKNKKKKCYQIPEQLWSRWSASFTKIIYLQRIKEENTEQAPLLHRRNWREWKLQDQRGGLWSSRWGVHGPICLLCKSMRQKTSGDYCGIMESFICGFSLCREKTCLSPLWVDTGRWTTLVSVLNMRAFRVQVSLWRWLTAETSGCVCS